MKQSISWSSFSAGLVVFSGLGTEMISKHSWADLTTPLGVFHLLVLGMSFVAMIGGALAVQLPRSGSHSERVDDPRPELPKEDK